MRVRNDRISKPYRSRPGKTTAFSIGHQGRNAKYATGAKLRGREDITSATGNIETLRTDKLEELLHEIHRYKWSILGECEMRWKILEENPTDGECISVEMRTDMNKEWVS